MARRRTVRHSRGRDHSAKARRRARYRSARVEALEDETGGQRRRPCLRSCSRRRCRPGRRCGAPAAGCRSAARTAASGRRARSARAPASRRWRQRCGATALRRSPVAAPPAAGGPAAARETRFRGRHRRCRARPAGAPRSTICGDRPRPRRCRPFCSVRRLTTVNSGAVSCTSRPHSRCSADLAVRLAGHAVGAESGAAIALSCAGSQTASSTPLRMP